MSKNVKRGGGQWRATNAPKGDGQGKSTNQQFERLITVERRLGVMEEKLGHLITLLTPESQTVKCIAGPQEKGKEKVGETGIGSSYVPEVLLIRQNKEVARRIMQRNLEKYRIPVHESLKSRMLERENGPLFKTYMHKLVFGEEGIGASGQDHAIAAVSRVLEMVRLYDEFARKEYRHVVSLYGSARDRTMAEIMNAGVEPEFQLKVTILQGVIDNKDVGRLKDPEYETLSSALDAKPDAFFMFNVYKVESEIGESLMVDEAWVAQVVKIAPLVWVGHPFTGPIGQFLGESVYIERNGEITHYPHPGAVPYIHPNPKWMLGNGYYLSPKGNMSWYMESRAVAPYVRVYFSDRVPSHPQKTEVSMSTNFLRVDLPSLEVTEGETWKADLKYSLYCFGAGIPGLGSVFEKLLNLNRSGLVHIPSEKACQKHIFRGLLSHNKKSHMAQEVEQMVASDSVVYAFSKHDPQVQALASLDNVVADTVTHAIYASAKTRALNELLLRARFGGDIATANAHKRDMDKAIEPESKGFSPVKTGAALIATFLILRKFPWIWRRFLPSFGFAMPPLAKGDLSLERFLLQPFLEEALKKLLNSSFQAVGLPKSLGTISFVLIEWLERMGMAMDLSHKSNPHMSKLNCCLLFTVIYLPAVIMHLTVDKYSWLRASLSHLMFNVIIGFAAGAGVAKFGMLGVSAGSVSAIRLTEIERTPQPVQTQWQRYRYEYYVQPWADRPPINQHDHYVFPIDEGDETVPSQAESYYEAKEQNPLLRLSAPIPEIDHGTAFPMYVFLGSQVPVCVPAKTVANLRAAVYGRLTAQPPAEEALQFEVWRKILHNRVHPWVRSRVVRTVDFHTAHDEDWRTSVRVYAKHGVTLVDCRYLPVFTEWSVEHTREWILTKTEKVKRERLLNALEKYVSDGSAARITPIKPTPVFVKTNEMLCKLDPKTGCLKMKPRIISNVDPIYQILCGPELDEVKKVLKETWPVGRPHRVNQIPDCSCRPCDIRRKTNGTFDGTYPECEEPAGPLHVKYFFHFSYAPGATNAELGEWMDTVHKRGRLLNVWDDNYRVMFFIIAAGDDTLIAVCYKGHVGFLEGDFGMYDQSESRGPLMYQDSGYVHMGVSTRTRQALLDSWKSPFKVEIPKIGTFWIKRDDYWMRNTGGPDTTHGNSDIGIGAWYNVLRSMPLGLFTHKFWNEQEEQFMDLSLAERYIVAEMKKLGFEVKLKTHHDIYDHDTGGPTFLKGWWLPSGEGFKWTPLPSRLLKFGKCQRDPSEIYLLCNKSTGDAVEDRRLSALCFLSDVARSWGNLKGVPLLSEVQTCYIEAPSPWRTLYDTASLMDRATQRGDERDDFGGLQHMAWEKLLTRINNKLDKYGFTVSTKGVLKRPHHIAVKDDGLPPVDYDHAMRRMCRRYGVSTEEIETLIRHFKEGVPMNQVIVHPLYFKFALVDYS